MTAPPDPAERLTAIESTVAHLQHDFDQLHQVALELQADIVQIRMLLQKFSVRMERLAEAPEVRSPEMERPPHY